MRDGPAYDDEGGELVPSILSCRGCRHLRRHDFHYTFCAAQGGKPSYWSEGEAVVQLYHGAYPNDGCPFPTPTPLRRMNDGRSAR
jgi:hypothetical protein